MFETILCLCWQFKSSSFNLPSTSNNGVTNSCLVLSLMFKAHIAVNPREYPIITTERKETWYIYIFMFGIDLCSKLVSYSLFSKAHKISNKSRIWINMQAIMWNMTRSLGTVNELLAEFPLLNCPGNRFLIVLEYPAALSLSQWKYANYYNILVS